MDKPRKLFDLARKCLVGGVDSPVRSFAYVKQEPLLIKSGKGSKVYDYAGREYVDYVLSWGGLILGHAHKEVIKAVNFKIRQGLSFGTTNRAEIELARLIIKAIPFIEKIRFVNSGTEAVMGAVRLARGFTGRDIIIKFENSYHGHADYLLVKGGSGLATLGIATSSGVPKDFLKHTLVLPYADKRALFNAFRKYKGKIAAVLVEPAGANCGVTPPDLGFLRELRELTLENKSLLIFDEVINAFRFNFGSLSQKLKIEPDLICLGKVIAGGLPVGAYAGKAVIMDNLAPLGKVYQASTFSGNPIVMQSGLATLSILKQSKADYLRIRKLNDYLCFELKKAAINKRIEVEIALFQNMFSLRFRSKEAFGEFYGLMLRQGIFFAPSEFEANFLSFAHCWKDIQKTLRAAESAFKEMEKKNGGKHRS